MTYQEIREEFTQNQRIDSVHAIDYLPFQSKLELVNDIVNDAAFGEKYIPIIKLDFYFKIHTILKYYNISLLEDEIKKLPDIYDDMEQTGLMNYLYYNIPAREKEQIYNWVYKTADQIRNYQSSVLGILEAISRDYSNIEFKTDEIVQELKNTEGMKLLQDIAPLLG